MKSGASFALVVRLVTPEMASGRGDDGWRENGGTAFAVSMNDTMHRVTRVLEEEGLSATVAPLDPYGRAFITEPAS